MRSGWLLLFLVCFLGCSHKLAKAPSPAPDELRAALDGEFARLGIDPAKVAAAAPSGADNAVFDLTAEVIDPDGPGGDPPSGVQLMWTERLIGDYDQNGQVNISDLTPIGANWKDSVEYDDPQLHDGIAFWPDGDPDGEGALNWRRARVDGDGNGEINISELTPLAGHWQETLSGYRVYRTGPDQAVPVLLSNPGDSLTVPRPSNITATQPVRYGFVDEPPVAGSYEYFVVATDASGLSPQESDQWSNAAQVEIEVGFADTLPPQWDGHIGILSAADNGDGTALIAWGTATDQAPLGVAPNPPVTYTVFWSLTSPVDFDNAARERNVVSPWTSPLLLSGAQYYFAVRASDSADPENSDSNTVEQEMISTGGATVDVEPPVWVESGFNQWGEFGSLQGIKTVQPGPGMLTIEHALASDNLSPPVHYDLYYISSRQSQFIFTNYYHGDLVPGVQIVQDIPPKLELPWNNREQVNLLVRARDSASSPNQEQNYKFQWVCPSDLEAHPISFESLGGLSPGDENADISGLSLVDHLDHQIYSLYGQESNGIAPKEIWCLEFNADTAEYRTARVTELPEGADYLRPSWIRKSNQGVLWCGVSADFGAFDERPMYFKRSAQGSWSRWEKPAMPSTALGAFDHNGNLAVFSLSMSTTQAKRLKLFYNYWNDASQAWVQELICDPGGYATSYVKPNGEVQVIVEYDWDTGGLGEPPTGEQFGHIHERSVSGTWTEVYRTDGPGQIELYAGTYPFWDASWPWATTTYQNAEQSILAYTDADNFVVVPQPVAPDGNPVFGKPWLMGSELHFLPSLQIDNSYLFQWFHRRGYSSQIEPRASNALGLFYGGSTIIDPTTGFSAVIRWDYNFTTQNYGLYLFKTGDTQSVYDPLTW